MGIVVNQSIRNTLVTYIGFAIGAVNALFMYTHFLGKTYYGLTAFLLSSGNILMPLMAFGVHNTLIKFYSDYKTEEEKSQFLTFMLLLPLILIIPIGIVGYCFYGKIAEALSKENPIIYDYIWLIPLIGLCMGYFEIFYAWVKVHMKSVLGNFIKEVLLRVLISIFLFAVYLKLITAVQFIYITVGIYFVTTIIMVIVALRIKQPALSFRFPENKVSVFVYSIFIILAGSVANLLLDVDKFMLNLYMNIDNIAFYSVAIFIATVIAVPSRAMHQITYPITAKLMGEKKHDELNELYKKTSITLQVVGGFVMLGIFININSLYELIPEEYAGGIFVVFAIGLSKYFDLILGNNNAIIFNSIYYRMVLILGLFLGILAVTLNIFLIPKWGINGAALATLIAITMYSFAKLMFVVGKMNLYPFTSKTLHSFAITGITFLLFYFWDFQFAPLLNICCKSILFITFYFFLNYKLQISSDLNLVFDGLINRFRK